MPDPKTLSYFKNDTFLPVKAASQQHRYIYKYAFFVGYSLVTYKPKVYNERNNKGIKIVHWEYLLTIKEGSNWATKNTYKYYMLIKKQIVTWQM